MMKMPTRWRKKKEKIPKRKTSVSCGPAINPRRRAERAQMYMLGITRKKAFRKWQRKMRRIEREGR